MYVATANSDEVRFVPYITVSGILHGGLIVLLGLSAYFHCRAAGGPDRAAEMKVSQ